MRPTRRSNRRKKIDFHDNPSPEYLMIQDFGEKGCGIVASENISKDSFVVIYAGRKVDHEPAGDDSYVYEVKQKRRFWIDATVDDGSFGRLINDDHISPNLKVKLVKVQGESVPAFFAGRDISKGEELAYDYGGGDYPWRRNKTLINQESSTNEVPVEKSALITIETAEALTIKDTSVDDTGSYTVETGNTVADFDVNVKDKPSKPNNLSVSKVMKDSVVLSWQPPSNTGGSDISSYIIEKSDSKRNTWTRVDKVTSLTLTCDVQKLLEGNEYYFRVLAENDIGQGEAVELEAPIIVKSPYDEEPVEKSMLITIETAEALTIKDTSVDDTVSYSVETGNTVADFDVNVKDKPSKPNNLSVSKVMKDSVVLSWQPPSNTGGSDISSYIIEKSDSKRNTWTRVDKVTSLTLTCDVQKLLEGNEYYFRVLAENDIGQGEAVELEAPIIVKSPYDVPDSPSNLQVTEVTNNSVTLTWEMPQKDYDPPIISYILEKCQLPSNQWVKVSKKPIHNSVFTVPDLLENTEYKFRVAAKNAAVTGKASEPTSPIMAKDSFDKPSAPGVPNVTDVTNDSATLEWTPPSRDCGSPVFNYFIEYKPQSSQDWLPASKGMKVPTSLYTVPYLLEGEVYEFRVSAENKAGLGNPSSASNKVTIKAPIATGRAGHTDIQNEDLDSSVPLMMKDIKIVVVEQKKDTKVAVSDKTDDAEREIQAATGRAGHTDIQNEDLDSSVPLMMKDIKIVVVEQKKDTKVAVSDKTDDAEREIQAGLCGRVFVCSGSYKLKNQLVNLVGICGGEYVPKFQHNTTHVIMQTDKPCCCQRSLKYILGIAHHCWILDHKYIEECLKAGFFLPEEDFEILGDVNFPQGLGASLSRRTERLLMSGVKITFSGESSEFPRDAAESVVRSLGGEVIRNSSCIVSLDESGEPNTVTRDWLFDCLSNFTLLDRDPYYCGNSDRCGSESDISELGEVIDGSESKGNKKTKDTIRSRLYVVGSQKKENGKRLWNKRHVCVYCQNPYAKLARHLEQVHGTEIEVQRALAFNKSSIKRKAAWKDIQNKGDYAHNNEVYKKGEGEIIPIKRPRIATEGTNFVYCKECKGSYLKSDLYRHVKTAHPCKKAQNEKRTSHQEESASLLPVSLLAKQDFRQKILDKMANDEVSIIARNDDTVVTFGQRKFMKHARNPHQYNYIRQKMRELARFVITARNVDSSVKTLKDCIDPLKFKVCVTAVKTLCGFDESTSLFDIPSLATKIGSSLHKVARKIKLNASVIGDRDLKEKAETFIDQYKEEWDEEVSHAALETREIKRYNKPTAIPLAEDLKSLSVHLKVRASNIMDRSEITQCEWRDLCESTLAQVVLFNKRRAGETERLEVQQYLDGIQHGKTVHTEVLESLSPLEKKLTEVIDRVEVRGKLGRRVAILLPEHIKKQMDVLLKHRSCGNIDIGNQYMFARPGNAETPVRASDVLRKYAIECNAKNRETLTSTGFRKHVATISQMLNLKENELDVLAGFLGHDIRVHREFYRLPNDTVQVAKVSKLLLELERGNISKYRGKSLEEIQFDLDGVIDPRTKQQLSVFQALSNGILDQISGTYRNPDTGEIMSIPEAIQRGLIIADFKEHHQNGNAINGGFTPMRNKMQTVMYPVEGVIDPKTGEWIGVKEAITSGIIDPRTGSYTNPLTGEKMSILEAVQNGYLVADPALLDEITEDNGMYTCVDFSDVSYDVQSVVNPSTGEELTLKRAIQDGVIDPMNSLYRNPHTGETMALADAIKKGFIRVRPVDSSTPNENILTFKQLHIKKQKFIPGAGDILEGFDEFDGEERDPNKKLADKLRSKHDVSVPLMKNSGKREISLEDAVSQGLIDFAKNEIKLSGQEPMSIEEAIQKKLVSPKAAKQILDVYKDNSLGHLIDEGKFDPDTGLVTDPNTGHTISLQAAISQRIIDPNSVFLFDNNSGKVISLATAIENGLFNPETGKFVDPKTGEEMSLSDAVLKGLVQTHINPDKIVESNEILSKLCQLTDTSVKCVVSPLSGEEISLEDAIKQGILDLKNGQYINPVTGEVMPLAEAIKAGKVDPRLCVPLLEALNDMSLKELADKGVINLQNGVVTDPKTGQRMTMAEAIENGVLDPNSVMLVDNESGNIVSLGSLIDSGIFDPEIGKFRNPQTGEVMSLQEAIDRGLIDPEIIPDVFADTSSTLRDLIDGNRVNPRTTSFVAPNGQKMSLRDALANGFLTMTSKVKVDPASGDVSLASEEEEVVQSLLDIKDKSEWLQDIERRLAQQKPPSERLETLEKQREDCHDLKQGVEERESDVKKSIELAETLVENNKADRKDEGAQQLQKLKSSTTDLRVRLDSAANETSKRCKRLDDMCDDLEDFYGKLQELDQWLDHAFERTEDLQSSKNGIDVQYSNFKDFVEELQGKEEEMSKVIKMADNFKEEAQDFEKEAENFKRRLQFMPPIQEEGDNQVIDDELEALEAKYKDISRKCAKHLEKLSGLVKHKKTFDDLNDKLANVYPTIEQALTDIDEGSFGKNPEEDKKNYAQLKDLKGDLIGQERKLKDFTNAADKLVAGLNEMGMRNKADDVKKKVEDTREKHDLLSEEISEKEQQLDTAVSQQQSVVNRLEGLKNWAAEAENVLDERPLISLDKDKLNQQIQDQRVLTAEIETNKGLIERLSHEAADTSSAQEAEEALSDLSDLLNELERKAEIRMYELEEVLTSINEIEGLMVSVDGWVTESIKSLKTKPKGTTQKAMKAKVDMLYGEKREKEFDMENLRNTSRRLMDDDRVCDQFVMKEGLSEVEAKWHELTELLVQQVSLEALTEVDGMLKYLDKAENEINTAEPISIEPETLGVQLKENLSFNADLNEKRNAVKDIINKCNKMLRETTNAQTDEIKSRLESIKAQADIVCHLSADRLQQLEAALPLATSFSESHAEVAGWLDEMEAELKAQGSPGDALDQVKKQYDNLKTTQQIIEDRKPFIDDLNATGLELMELCGDSDAGDIQTKLVNVNERFEKLKLEARGKLREMADTRQNMTQEVSDGLDNLLEDLSGLNRAIVNADPIPASPDKLKDDLEENKIILEELDRTRPHIHRAIEMAKKVVAQGNEDEIEAADIKQKISELNGLANQIKEGAHNRQGELQEALEVAEKFHDLCGDTMGNLRDLKDNMISQEPPGVDPQTVKEQQKELKELRKELGKARLSLDECRQKGEQLGTLVGDPGLIEIRKQLEDIHHLADDVHDIAKERDDDLRAALNHADKFQQLQESLEEWLPVEEHKLANMKPISNDLDTLQKQVDELKFFKSNVHPHVTEVQQLNQELAALKDMSPVAAETLQRPVESINAKWADMVQAITEREANLQEMQCKVGDIERGMLDVTNSLERAMTELNLMDIATGDPKCLEKHLKKLNLLQSDVKGQERASRKLNKALDDTLSHGGQDSPQLRNVQDEMNEMLRRVQADSKDKEAKMQEKLRRVKKYVGDVDDMIQWISDLRTELKSNTPFGALPDTAKEQFEKFQERHQELQKREEPTKALLEKGQEFIEACPAEDVVQISDRMKKLKDLWNDTKDRAQKRKDKMDEHLHNIDEFHGTLKIFTDWLNNAEVAIRAFKYPSKIVHRVVNQMEDHNKLKTELDNQIERMHTLDRTGTYLKYFGRKQDTIYIKNLLVGIRLRWKKLLRRTDERGRLFKQAYKEDKRFYDAWKSLCDWLDESSPKLARFMTPGYASKQDVEELKRFQHQLAAKHPAFYSASRLGRNLKDRCTKSDPEREELQQMLDDLKNKWNSVRSVVSKSQNKLDEALLTSGRVADALSSMLEWLGKVQSSLGEDQPILGDLDTVSMLIEQHKALQSELAAREQTVAAMKASGNLPPIQMEELNNLWESVNMLSEVREAKLKESLQLAEEFQGVVQVMREFLPQAEAELKFRSLPEDEVAIIQLIEKHEKFQAELRDHQDGVDKIKLLAEEILLNCHPNAIRFVKYYLTITQTRWDQLLQRAKSREHRLQDALRAIQGNAALVEELLSWLTDAQVLLSTKEKDPIPDDVGVVDTLCKEHSEFHEDINSKNADVERLTKILQHEPKSPGGPRNFGSHSRLNEIDGHNPRVLALQNRWRTVWRMSVDRKKKLEDALDTLLEMESIKNFDFELWKARYLKWIQTKKMRITDFFRRQDKDGDGFLSRDEFVNGMLHSGFKTNKTEMNAVFDLFDRENRDFIEYQEFIEAMKLKRHQKERLKGGNKMMSDTELIHDEIDREVALCTCRSPLRVEMVDECKYRFGEKSTIRLVRFLNSCVMVRVGGGWITLDEFLETNDPCRARGRTNYDLRKTLGGAETPTSPTNGNSTFRSRSGSGTYGYKSRQNDTGYASSISSAGSSGDSSLRRSKQMTTSMVNLSGNSNSKFVNSLRKHPDFGSSGSLSRSKRLSSSSSNITTPNKPRTPSTSTGTPRYMSPRQPFGRSTTPTPSTAFGRSTTPTPPRSSLSTPRLSSTPKATPTRSGRQTPTGRMTPTQSGRTTPTMSNGPRRLPTTPKTPKV